MTRVVRELGPLAIVVAAFGLAIFYLISVGNSIGNWLLAAFLIGHGWVHMMYVIPQPQAQARAANGTTWPFRLDHSWLSGSRSLHGAGLVLVAITVIGYMLAGLATIPVLVPVDLWAPLLFISTLASAALLLIFFNAGLLIGIAIDVGLLVAAALSGWRPA
jgi:hypothetical protein